MARNLWNKCHFEIGLVGAKGDKRLDVAVFYKKKQIAQMNWCGGISHDREFIVRYNEIYRVA